MKIHSIKSVSLLAVLLLLILAALTLLALPYVSSAQTASGFNTDMSVGSRGDDVTKLQTFLATNTWIYPQALITGYFGALTEAAVKQFQLYYGLPQVGRVGPLTRAKINTVIASGNGLDISAPFINGVNVQPGRVSSSVTWATSENAKGKVYYATSPITIIESIQPFMTPVASGAVAQTDEVFRLGQNVTIGGLTPNTTYYYVVFATDASGNVNITNGNSFTTTN